MSNRDEFEGIDISGPFGGVRIGSGPPRDWDDTDSDGDAEYRRIRRRVRQRLEFIRHLATYVLVVGVLALQFFTTFVSPSLWGKDVEERMVRRELEKRRGRATVIDEREPVPPHE